MPEYRACVCCTAMAVPAALPSAQTLRDYWNKQNPFSRYVCRGIGCEHGKVTAWRRAASQAWEACVGVARGARPHPTQTTGTQLKRLSSEKESASPLVALFLSLRGRHATEHSCGTVSRACSLSMSAPVRRGAVADARLGLA